MGITLSHVCLSVRLSGSHTLLVVILSLIVTSYVLQVTYSLLGILPFWCDSAILVILVYIFNDFLEVFNEFYRYSVLLDFTRYVVSIWGRQLRTWQQHFYVRRETRLVCWSSTIHTVSLFLRQAGNTLSLLVQYSPHGESISTSDGKHAWSACPVQYTWWVYCIQEKSPPPLYYCTICPLTWRRI